ncbi:MAG: hypothetical protein LWW81_15215 [Rhodocyclales bacterium]|nr:hypothetical protein [Rhodocyclales bacterium]
MLKKSGLGGLFAQKSVHPLADPRELRRVLGEVPRDNAFSALESLSSTLQSLAEGHDLALERLFEILAALEDAALPHLERLSREYLHGPRLSRAEEKRLWTINISYWRLLAQAYDTCLSSCFVEGRPSPAVRECLPELAVRMIGAHGAVLKWEHFQNGCGTNAIWKRLGYALLACLRERCANDAVRLPGMSRATSPLEAYDQVMVLHTASLDSLRPQEIELAERLLNYFLPRFGCTSKALHDSLYWVDLKLAQPPLRLAKRPEKATATQRFFKPDAAHEVMVSLFKRIEHGEQLPEDIHLGYTYPVAILRSVMRHLVTYLSPTPPLREHPRHRVRHQMKVLAGFANAQLIFSGHSDLRGVEDWQVEDVSLGGFGVVQKAAPGEGVKVGCLLSMQPAGGENWLPGVVRRMRRTSDEKAHLGIMLLSRQAKPALLYAYPTASPNLQPGNHVLMLDPEDAEIQRVLASPAAVSSGGAQEYQRAGRRYLLEPQSVLEQTGDYVLVRYRQSLLA